MTIQYNVPIKVLDGGSEHRVGKILERYSFFSDLPKDSQDPCFSKENLPYVGEWLVVKTLREEVATTAYNALHGVEGLLVFPITECDHEGDVERVNSLEVI